jgi:hypothetical protein
MSTSPPSTFEAIEFTEVDAALSDDVVGEAVATADVAAVVVDVADPSVHAKWVMIPAMSAAVAQAATNDIVFRPRSRRERSRQVLLGRSGCDWGSIILCSVPAASGPRWLSMRAVG